MCCNAASQPSKHRCWNRSRVSGPLLTTRFSDTAFAQKRNRDDTRDTGVLVTKEQKPEDPGAKSLCNDAKTNRCNSPGGAASVIWSQTGFERRRAFRGRTVAENARNDHRKGHCQ